MATSTKTVGKAAGKKATTTAGKTAGKTATTTAGKTVGKTGRPTKATSGSRTAAPRKAAGSGIPSLGDLGKLIGRMKVPGIDVRAIVESQRQDMQALAEANRQAYEGIRALAKRRNEMLRDSLKRWQQATKGGIAGEGLGERAEQAKREMQQALDNFRELVEMEAQSRHKAWKVLQDRFEANVANLQKLLQPKTGA